LCYKNIKQWKIILKCNKRPEGRIFAGIILVGVGAALLLRNSGFPFPNWLFSWPVILILVGIYSGFKHNFKNNSWIIMIGIGGFFLVDRFIPDLRLAPYFLAGDHYCSRRTFYIEGR